MSRAGGAFNDSANNETFETFVQVLSRWSVNTRQHQRPESTLEMSSRPWDVLLNGTEPEPSQGPSGPRAARGVDFGARKAALTSDGPHVAAFAEGRGLSTGGGP